MKRTPFLSEVKKFSHAVGHDIKQPLGLIRAYSYYIKKATQQSLPKLTEYTDKIDYQVDTISHMLNKIVDSSTLSSGTVSYALALNNMEPLLQTAIKLATELHPHSDIILTSPPCEVKVDKLYFPVAVAHIIENAIVFSDDSTPVTIQLTQERTRAIITVSDQGRNIPKEDVPFIFDAYFRGSNARGTSTKGLGLGLFIARLIIEAHSGTIGVKSTPKSGTTVTIALPK